LASGGGQGLYYGTDPSAVPDNEYDVHSVIEHETNELFGTSSCRSVLATGIVKACFGAESETDLFRYAADGSKVFLDPTPGAYFSYDGGATMATPGYNTTLIDEDYADYYPFSDLVRCSYVQSAEAALAQHL
jgi:hypothetical protein